jgi:glycosyltransferase involved in cell wall biosynthesis
MTAAGNPSIDVIVPVFNAEGRIRRSMQRLLELSKSAAGDIRVLVSDDGSTDDTASILRSFDDPRLRFLRSPSNSGRANACNLGAGAARGDYLLFLDADCQPAETDYFSVLGEQAAAGAELVYGPIAGTGSGFWQRYLGQVQHRRIRQATHMDHLLGMTTGNLLIRRELFFQAGGFCDAYRHYGFEDKDLIVRLLALQPRVVFDPRLAIRHDAGNTVAGYCRKMREAACHTAPIFFSRYPEAYRRMSYARLDPDLAAQPLRGILRQLGRYGAGPAMWLAEWAVDKPGLPWPMQALLVKLASAVSYLQGAAERPAV